jgi:hypothetical protein
MLDKREKRKVKRLAIHIGESPSRNFLWREGDKRNGNARSAMKCACGRGFLFTA